MGAFATAVVVVGRLALLVATGVHVYQGVFRCAQREFSSVYQREFGKWLVVVVAAIAPVWKGQATCTCWGALCLHAHVYGTGTRLTKRLRKSGFERAAKASLTTETCWGHCLTSSALNSSIHIHLHNAVGPGGASPAPPPPSLGTLAGWRPPLHPSRAPPASLPAASCLLGNIAPSKVP